MKIIGCIPSRYASTRLPGKPLCMIGNKPMILHVLERAKKAESLDKVVVLTDDERIYNVVAETGEAVVMTDPACANGTERIASYARSEENGHVFVNIQGDEVLLNASHVDALVEGFLARSQREMGTLAHWVDDPKVLNSATTAKVVTDFAGNALYFSRNCIPVTQSAGLPERALVQIGVYIYTRKTLLCVAALPKSPLETTEKLEQLRALEQGIEISVTEVSDYQSLSVDTEADLRKAQALFPAS